ncbi:MAG: hypothetical protein R6W89_10225 [Candidatus Hydrogenedentota bacterium]
MRYNPQNLLTLFAVTLLLAMGNATHAAVDLDEWEAAPLEPAELLEWDRWGVGDYANFRDEAVHMRETSGSEGLMLVSPEPYGEQVVLTYKAMTLRLATVLVAGVSAADAPGTDALTLPADYDGSMAPLIERSLYFFAFHNAPHMSTPFVNRFTPEGARLLQEAEQRHMQPGYWHDIEVGRDGDRVWLKIDGEEVLDADDDDPPAGGRLMFRIRGTGLEPASCLIRDVVIYEPGESE